MNFIRNTLTCAACAVTLLAATGCSGDKPKDAAAEAAKTTAKAPDKGEITEATVVVDVDGDVLTYGEAITNIKRMIRSQGAPADQIDMIADQIAPQAFPRMAEQFVVTSLLRAEAARRGLKATDADIEEAISNAVTRLPPGMEFADILDRMGMTMEDVRKDIAEGLPVNKLVEEVSKGVELAEDAVKAFYEENARYFEVPEQVEASHILITVTNEAQKAEAKAKIEAIREKLLAGEDFAKLASENSDCPSKAQGGNLGYFGHGQMVKPFEEAAFALATNEISDVVETTFGFHVIKVTDKKEASKKALDEVREDIETHLRTEKGADLMEKLVEELRAKAKIIMNEALTTPPEPAAPEMTEEELSEALEAVPASEAVEAPAAAPAEPAPVEKVEDVEAAPEAPVEKVEDVEAAPKAPVETVDKAEVAEKVATAPSPSEKAEAPAAAEEAKTVAEPAAPAAE